MYMILKEKGIEPMALVGFREKKWRQSTLDEFCESENKGLPLALLYAANRTRQPLEDAYLPLLGHNFGEKQATAGSRYRVKHKRGYLRYGTL